MKLELLINGTIKTFSIGFIPGRLYRKTLEMQKRIGKDVDAETLDAMVEYVVDLFNKQFTMDDFYDGIDARIIIETIVKCINEIVSGSVEAVGADGTSPN